MTHPSPPVIDRRPAIEAFARDLLRTEIWKRGFCPDCSRRISGDQIIVYREYDGDRFLELRPGDKEPTYKPFTGNPCDVHTEYSVRAEGIAKPGEPQ